MGVMCMSVLCKWKQVCKCVAVCCSVLQCVAVCCTLLQCHIERLAHVLARDKSRMCMGLANKVLQCHSVLQCVVCCGVLQCVAVCYSVLQCVAVSH